MLKQHWLKCIHAGEFLLRSSAHADLVLTTMHRRSPPPVLLMTGFNFLSHGSQDLYPTYLQVSKGFSTHQSSIATMCVLAAPLRRLATISTDSASCPPLALAASATAAPSPAASSRATSRSLLAGASPCSPSSHSLRPSSRCGSCPTPSPASRPGASLCLPSPFVPQRFETDAQPLNFESSAFMMQFGVQGAWGVMWVPFANLALCSQADADLPPSTPQPHHAHGAQPSRLPRNVPRRGVSARCVRLSPLPLALARRWLTRPDPPPASLDRQHGLVGRVADRVDRRRQAPDDAQRQVDRGLWPRAGHPDRHRRRLHHRPYPPSLSPSSFRPLTLSLPSTRRRS